MASSSTLQSMHGHSSPSVSSPGKKRYGQFAETSPKTLVGLQKVNVQLQKDIEKLERQAQTSVNNIANHQQAMKMSWRRLEHRRRMDSPLLSRSHKDSEPPGTPKRHRTVLSSNTQLYVGSTPQIYNVDYAAGRKEGVHPTVDEAAQTSDHASSSTPHLIGGPAHQSSRGQSLAHFRSSPYITSPYTLRRSAAKRRAPSSLAVPQTAPTTPPTHGEGGAPNPKVEVEDADDPHAKVVVGERGRTKSASELKLPPITSPTQPTLVTHTAVTDKNTLLQASQLMGLDSSKGPSRFREFYASDRPPSRAIRLSSPPPTALKGRNQAPMKEGEKSSSDLESGEALPGLSSSDSSSELTLAELFEQIRHCRYIRHYRPDGSEVEDFS